MRYLKPSNQQEQEVELWLPGAGERGKWGLFKVYIVSDTRHEKGLDDGGMMFACR